MENSELIKKFCSDRENSSDEWRPLPSKERPLIRDPLIPEFNNNLKKLSELQNKIDLSWDQDWYPTFQETATS